MSKLSDLKAETDRHGITVVGTGNNGRKLKVDYENVLKRFHQRVPIVVRPTDLFLVVLMKCNLKTMLRVVSLPALLPTVGHSVSFWRQYLNRDQEKLHKVFSKSAKYGHWSIFKFLWKTPIEYGSPKLTMVKERRELFEGYERAFIADHEVMAHDIRDLDEQWVISRLNFYYPEFKTNDDSSLLLIKQQYIDLNLRMNRAAKNSDEEEFTSLEKQQYALRRTYKKQIDYYEIDVHIEDALAESDDLDFLLQMYTKFVPQDNDALDQMVFFLLGRGKYEVVISLLDYLELDVNNVNLGWIHLLSSKRPDSLQLIQRYMNIPSLEAQDIAMGEYIGNINLFRQYATEDPDDHTSILRSWHAFPADLFISIYLSTAKCISDDDTDGLYYEHPGVQGMLEGWREAGYEYLAQQFEKLVPICPS